MLPTVRALIGAAAAAVALTAPTFAGFAFADDGGGAVYTMTNSSSGNSIVAFQQQRDGSLNPSGS
jgi:hypothetical protein